MNILLSLITAENVHVLIREFTVSHLFEDVIEVYLPFRTMHQTRMTCWLQTRYMPSAVVPARCPMLLSSV